MKTVVCCLFKDNRDKFGNKPNSSVEKKHFSPFSGSPGFMGGENPKPKIEMTNNN
jgi:hypothetical protein